MNASDLDTRINRFMERKYAMFPELVASGRRETRTVKYAQALRVSGQVLLSH